MKRRDGKVMPSWWTLEGDREVAGSVVSHARLVEDRLASRREEMLHHMRLYAGKWDLKGGGYATDQVPSYNIARSLTDTAASLIAQSHPRPFYLTQDGGWELKQRARLKARVIDGQFEEAGVNDSAWLWFLDAAICGVGVLAPYVCPHTHKVLIDRVHPLMMLVDPREGIGGKEPRTTYRLELADRGVLMEEYDDPEDRARIRRAEGPKGCGFRKLDRILDYDSQADQILIVTAVHLPSSPDAKDGKRVVAMSSGLLGEVEDYDCEVQPYATYRYQVDPNSWYGMSLVERTRAACRRLNRLEDTIETASRLCSTAWVMNPRGCDVEFSELTNMPAIEVSYDERAGTAPTIQSFTGVNPSWFAERDKIREETFAELGYSSLQAEGQKPAGLNSGQAQIVHDDIQSRRHIMPTREWERAHMRLTRLFEWLNDANSEDGHDVPLPAKHHRGRDEYVKEVKWSEVRKDAGKMYTRTFPVSSLPTTPRGKWIQVQEFIKAGFVSRPFGQQLLDFPDIDDALKFELADMYAVMADIEAIVDGEDILPDALVSPEMAVDVARASYLQLRNEKAPEEILERCREYIQFARQSMNVAEQGARAASVQQQQMAQGGGPAQQPAPGMAPQQQAPGAVPPGA